MVRRLYFALLGALCLLGLGISQAIMAQTTTQSSMPSAEKSCVESTPLMRRNHMDYLLHQRDETLRRGIRSGKYSLMGCIDCHARRDKQGRMIPVNAPGAFCQGCHAYAAVSLDCFQCHVTTPRGLSREGELSHGQTEGDSP